MILQNDIQMLDVDRQEVGVDRQEVGVVSREFSTQLLGSCCCPADNS